MHLPRLAKLIALSLIVIGHARAQDFTLKIIALNDFHGNVQSPGTFRANADSQDLPSGGIDVLAAYVKRLKAENPLNVVVSAGDLTGGGPLLSSLFHDEDTIEAMNRLGLEINAVGNHEFDKGPRELMRLQHGGCYPNDSNTCKGAAVGTPVPFEGAHFQYLAANVFDASTGKTIFPAYTIKTYRGVKVAFIGLTLKDTPTIVIPTSIVGLRFADEATTINAIVRKLRRQGVESFIVLIHEGGRQTTEGTPDINACKGKLIDTPIHSIVGKLDDAVDLVLSAHTHQPYICQIPNRAGRKITVTSASAFGRLLTDIDVTIDPRTRDITHVSAHNILIDRTPTSGIAPDPAIAAIVDRYTALAAPIVNQVVGTIREDIPFTDNPAGESPMGDLIADAQLEATNSPSSGGAVIAFMNDGGIRTGLPFISPTEGIPNGQVTYGELFGAQPFGNNLVTMTLTGAQIKAVLEEQFKGCALNAPGQIPPTTDRTLQVSTGFTFTWNSAGDPCNKVDPASIKLHGVPLTPSSTYRVTVNSLLAGGGAQLDVLKQGTDRRTGPLDLEAMAAYFAHHGTIAPPPLNRITRQP